MEAKKLDNKASVAGLLLLLNVVLWFVQICLDYAIKDGGFWGIGGVVQNLTVVLADPMNWLFLLAMLIAAIMLLTRNRIAAVIGLIVLAAYFVYSMKPWDTFTLKFDVIALVIAIGLTAVAVGMAAGDPNGGSRIAYWVAIIAIVVFAILHVVGRIVNGGYGYGFAGLPVTLVYGLRYALLALGLFFAANVSSEKKDLPEGAHWG